MGGKNHQPCGAYLPESTRLSRSLSLAHARLELANVALEDLLLGELVEGKHGDIRDIIDHLDGSIVATNDAVTFAKELEMKLDENSFVDLPTLCKLDLDAIADNFAKHCMAEFHAANEVAERYRTSGFRGVLAYFHRSIIGLRQLTQQLRYEVQQLSGPAADGEVHLVLEENRHGNIKPTFAKLYTNWERFNAFFLASSLLSTEVWYAFRGHGSLADPAARVRVA
jgi:hypothetical protein